MTDVTGLFNFWGMYVKLREVKVPVCPESVYIWNPYRQSYTQYTPIVTDNFCHVCMDGCLNFEHVTSWTGCAEWRDEKGDRKSVV